MKRIYALAILVLALSCQPDYTLIESAPPTLQTGNEIDAFIRESIRKTGDFRWAAAPDELVWSALHRSDAVLSVGYKPRGSNSNISDHIEDIDIQAPDWKQAREQVLNLIWTEEYALDPTLQRTELEVFEETVLPLVDVRVKSLKTIQKLRASGLVRYIEPMGYDLGQTNSRAKVAAGSGCGYDIPDPADPLFAGVDYDEITPSAKSSWNHPYHGIRDAWAKNTGKGQKLVIIDTGVSYDQENLSTAINQGSSSGRTYERLVTLPRATGGPAETPNDGCGHGTSMAGAAVAPRGTDGAAAGVAYNASVVTIRGAADVYLNESREIKGVSDAYTKAANRTDIRIISMSMGRTLYNSQLADAIQYAYNKKKLMFCAGGTSYDWSAGFVGVIFPANMDQVQAVTGVQDNLTRRCDDCHDGRQIDFVVVMEKASNKRHVPTLALSGDVPATVGGSSVATAMTAGMATLVWAQTPSLTREQVVDRLARASNYYPNRDGSFGWGRINVNTALSFTQ